MEHGEEMEHGGEKEGGSSHFLSFLLSISLSLINSGGIGGKEWGERRGEKRGEHGYGAGMGMEKEGNRLSEVERAEKAEAGMRGREKEKSGREKREDVPREARWGVGAKRRDRWGRLSPRPLRRTVRSSRV